MVNIPKRKMACLGLVLLLLLLSWAVLLRSRRSGLSWPQYSHHVSVVGNTSVSLAAAAEVSEEQRAHAILLQHWQMPCSAAGRKTRVAVMEWDPSGFGNMIDFAIVLIHQTILNAQPFVYSMKM